jgi:hypothetical protein
LKKYVPRGYAFLEKINPSLPPRPSTIKDMPRTLATLPVSITKNEVKYVGEYFGEMVGLEKDGEGIEYFHDQYGEGGLHHAYFIKGKIHMGIRLEDNEYIYKG